MIWAFCFEIVLCRCIDDSLFAIYLIYKLISSVELISIIRTGNTAPRIQVPERADSGIVSGSNPGSFNPFDLPSPTYASRVPTNVDNNFADFSPVAGAPLAPPPLPMRSGFIILLATIHCLPLKSAPAFSVPGGLQVWDSLI